MDRGQTDQPASSVPTLLVVNPLAGKGKGRRCWTELREHLDRAFPNLVVRFSEYAGHGFELGRQAREQKFPRIITIGGDGTPFEIINGLYAAGRPEYEIDIGMIPAGTGNSFIRDYFSTLSPRQVLANIVRNRRQRIDLIKFHYWRDGKEQYRYFLNILGIGLIADILKLTNEKLKFLGALGYSVAVLVRLARKMRNTITVDRDGGTIVFHDSALVISNSKFTGGKMMIAPQADAQDGLADLVVFNAVNRRQIVAIFSRVFQGKHLDHPNVMVSRGRQIRIEASPPQLLMADGELLGQTPLRLKVWPRELSVLL